MSTFGNMIERKRVPITSTTVIVWNTLVDMCAGSAFSPCKREGVIKIYNGYIIEWICFLFSPKKRVGWVRYIIMLYVEEGVDYNNAAAVVSCGCLVCMIVLGRRKFAFCVFTPELFIAWTHCHVTHLCRSNIFTHKCGYSLEM